MSDAASPPPPSSTPYGPTTAAEIKPMRLEKAISVMEDRLRYLESQVQERIAAGLGVGYKLREMAAIKALLHEAIG